MANPPQNEQRSRTMSEEEKALIHKRDPAMGVFENDSVFFWKLDKYLQTFESRQVQEVRHRKSNPFKDEHRDLVTRPKNFARRGNLRSVAMVNGTRRRHETNSQLAALKPAVIRARERENAKKGILPSRKEVRREAENKMELKRQEERKRELARLIPRKYEHHKPGQHGFPYLQAEGVCVHHIVDEAPAARRQNKRVEEHQKKRKELSRRRKLDPQGSHEGHRMVIEAYRKASLATAMEVFASDQDPEDKEAHSRALSRLQQASQDAESAAVAAAKKQADATAARRELKTAPAEIERPKTAFGQILARISTPWSRPATSLDGQRNTVPKGPGGNGTTGADGEEGAPSGDNAPKATLQDKLSSSRHKMHVQYLAALNAVNDLGKPKEYYTVDDLVMFARDGLCWKVMDALDQYIPKSEQEKHDIEPIDVNDVGEENVTALYAAFLGSLEAKKREQEEKQAAEEAKAAKHARKVKRAKKRSKNQGLRGDRHRQARGAQEDETEAQAQDGAVGLVGAKPPQRTSARAEVAMQRMNRVHPRVRKQAALEGVLPEDMGKADYDRTLGLLLARGADAQTKEQSQDSQGLSLLHNAVQFSSMAGVEWCIEHEIPIDVLDHFDRTPLMYASANGDLPLILSLITHQASVFQQDLDGATPLHYAARSGGLKAVKLLLIAGSDKNVLDKATKLPEDYARKHRQLQSLDYLQVFAPKSIPVTEFLKYAAHSVGIPEGSGKSVTPSNFDESSVLSTFTGFAGVSLLEEESLQADMMTVDTGAGQTASLA